MDIERLYLKGCFPGLDQPASPSQVLLRGRWSFSFRAGVFSGPPSGAFIILQPDGLIHAFLLCSFLQNTHDKQDKKCLILDPVWPV